MLNDNRMNTKLTARKTDYARWFVHRDLCHLSLQRKWKNIYYPLLYLALAFISLLTSVSICEAQLNGSTGSSQQISNIPNGFVVFVVAAAAIATALILWPLFRLARNAGRKNSSSDYNKQLNALQWVLLETETNTFSLARTQFVWWLSLIIFGYLFLSIGQIFVPEKLAYIPLSNFTYTFLISLTTLVTAQAISTVRGSKGSGEVHPAWSDLVVHGGVIALERIQQLAWNAIVGIAFIVIVIATYPTTPLSLPNIPSELLVLMGISAAGYVSGKAVRLPGPIISQIIKEPSQPNMAPTFITIAGDHFSLGSSKMQKDETGKAIEVPNQQLKDAGVTVQVVFLDEKKQEKRDTLREIKKDDIITLEFDTESPTEFARKLQVNFRDFPSDWLTNFFSNLDSKKVKIIVINADGQLAAWNSSAEAVR